MRWRANVADELRALAAERGGRFAWPRVVGDAEAGRGKGGASGDEAPAGET